MKVTLRSVFQKALGELGLTAKARQINRHRTVTFAEYWVYLPEPALPDQDQVMKQLYDSRAIGREEGLVFADIRLQTVLVLKSKNKRLFRSDPISESEGYTPEILASIADCEGLARITFISEEPVASPAYLRLLPNLCGVVAELGNAPAINDVTQQKLFAASDFAHGVQQAPSPADPDLHVRSIWHPGAEPHATTLGMHKRGIPDLTTGPMEPDSRLLAGHLLTQAAATLWNEPDIVYNLPKTGTTNFFGQDFQFMIEKRNRAGHLPVRLYRSGTF